ncbi:MAG: polysaccharide biosynthesis/export family protein [Syntrophobacteraceae bacterium]|nr:polysaccharide biosynthesis/export family protein [Syntrophobacteraceae bacterium]
MAEIRTGGPSYAPVQVAQAGGVQDPRARSVELQDRLLKMSAMMPTQQYTDYKVGPEDALQVTFLGSGSPSGASAAPAGVQAAGPSQLGGGTDQLSGVFRVNGRGEIRLMLVGNVKVEGLTPIEIAEKLTKLYKDENYLVEPQITVTVAEYRHSQVAVSGAVIKPGYYPLIGPRSLLEVLSMAGGLAGGTGGVATGSGGSFGRSGRHGKHCTPAPGRIESCR